MLEYPRRWLANNSENLYIRDSGGDIIITTDPRDGYTKLASADYDEAYVEALLEIGVSRFKPLLVLVIPREFTLTLKPLRYFKQVIVDGEDFTGIMTCIEIDQVEMPLILP